MRSLSQILSAVLLALCWSDLALAEPPDASQPLDPAVLAQAIVGMQACVIAWWVEDPSRASRESVIATLTRIQLSGTDPRS